MNTEYLLSLSDGSVSLSQQSSLLKKKLEEHLWVSLISVKQRRSSDVVLMLCVFCRVKLHEAHSDLQKKREVIDDLEPHVDSNSEWEQTHMSSSRSKVTLINSSQTLQSCLVLWKHLSNWVMKFCLCVCQWQRRSMSCRRSWRRRMTIWDEWRRDTRDTWTKLARSVWRQVDAERWRISTHTDNSAHMCVFQVIKTLDPKQKSNVVPAEVQALKNQLTEKDRKIQHLEVRHTQTHSLLVCDSVWLW